MGLWPCAQTATRSPGVPFNGLHPRNPCNYMDYYSFLRDRRMSWPGWLIHSGHYSLPKKWSHVNHRSGRSASDRRPNHWATPPTDGEQRVTYVSRCRVECLCTLLSSREHMLCTAEGRGECPTCLRPKLAPIPAYTFTNAKLTLHANTSFSAEKRKTHGRPGNLFAENGQISKFYSYMQILQVTACKIFYVYFILQKTLKFDWLGFNGTFNTMPQ